MGIMESQPERLTAVLLHKAKQTRQRLVAEIMIQTTPMKNENEPIATAAAAARHAVQCRNATLAPCRPAHGDPAGILAEKSTHMKSNS
jgi:hypothetical protein